ncbi:hypothetical protein L6R29_19520 [Myxococcota bacterium]|nr:hypothetical protein [Myxococcota bacterium]
MPFPIIPIIIGALTAVAATTLIVACWDEIVGWFSEKKTDINDYGELIKHRLANGKYKLVGGVFSSRGMKKAENVWETEQLDDELQKKFAYSNQIRI